LILRPVHPEILRFKFKRFFVIAVVEKLEPMQRGRAGLIFISALLCPRCRVHRAAAQQ